ncbi:MAG TPA: hypothetical protein VJY54_06335 [Lachnospiraceae bacterium]|nr:hypothetical protein [Lachnospiraceae bacterium]
MAMSDWNHDGKNNGIDNYIEYNIVNGSGNKSSGGGKHSGGGMSTLEAIFCVISGLLEESILFTALEVDVEDVSAFVLILLWILFSSITTAVVEWYNRVCRLM